MGSSGFSGRSLSEYVRIALRLTVRNRLALIYGYLFPVMFLAAFLVLYRYETTKLYIHMGELLTMNILSNACFGLPTSLVNERTRGLWRQYRVTPVSTSVLLAGTLWVRFLTVVVAGLIQLGLAMWIGHWVPAHPAQLALGYCFAAFGLIGLGLLLAAIANTVQGVQALGQCLFFPMVIIGGVGVRLERLPEWAHNVSVFMPGRYAVETLQACVSGAGLQATTFPIAALVLIGAATGIAGARLFRWDAGRRVLHPREKAWVGGAVATWILVGALALQRPGTAYPSRNLLATAKAGSGSAQQAGPAPKEPPAAGVAQTGTATPPTPTAAPGDEPWRKLGPFQFAALPLAEMPADDGNIAPIAGEGEEAGGSSLQQLRRVEQALQKWGPNHLTDRVQNVRNTLALIGAADFAQSSIERFLPAVAVKHLRSEIPDEELAKILCWIALHPDEGDLPPPDDPLMAELGAINLPPAEVRNRVYFYAVKLTRWVIGW